MIPIGQVKPYTKNPRKNDRAVDLVAKSIKEFGFQNPIILDKNSEIIAGHTRLKAAEKLKLKEVPVIRAEDLTEEQVKAFRIMDNKSSEYASWDKDLLKEELVALQNLDFRLDMTGFSFRELGQILEKDVEEDFVEVGAYERAKRKTKIQLGDLYDLGDHRLLCGDATRKEDIERLMNNQKADMVFTDPPYGIFLDTDFSSMEKLGKGKIYEKVKGDDDFKPEIITSVFDNFDYCKEIFLWGADYYAELVRERNKGSFIVWDKMQGGVGVNDDYDKMFGSNFELCWSKAKHKRAIARVLWKGIFGLNDRSEDSRSRLHPTQKPIKLCAWFINKFSKKNNLLVDVFGGSGSTLIACEQLNRTCFMLELDPVYCQIIINRWEKLTGKVAKKH